MDGCSPGETTMSLSQQHSTETMLAVYLGYSSRPLVALYALTRPSQSQLLASVMIVSLPLGYHSRQNTPGINLAV
jgi:hypothetical protein